jgi:hypothetical protein
VRKLAFYRESLRVFTSSVMDRVVASVGVKAMAGLECAMTDDPLWLVERRIYRAQSYIDALDERMRVQRSKDKEGLKHETDPDGSHHTYYLGKVDPIPVTANLAASDCLHNLRSALDNLVFKLSELHQARLGKTVPVANEKDIRFPIEVSTHRYKSIAGEALRYVSDEARELVCGNQPYKRFNPPQASPLWTLDELQNIDKHRYVVRLTHDVNTVGIVPKPGRDIKVTPGPAWLDIGRFKENEELCTLTVDPPDPEFEPEIDPNFPIVFDQGPADGEPIKGALGRLRYAVLVVLADARRLPECL